MKRRESPRAERLWRLKNAIIAFPSKSPKKVKQAISKQRPICKYLETTKKKASRMKDLSKTINKYLQTKIRENSMSGLSHMKKKSSEILCSKSKRKLEKPKKAQEKKKIDSEPCNKKRAVTRTKGSGSSGIIHLVEPLLGRYDSETESFVSDMENHIREEDVTSEEETEKKNIDIPNMCSKKFCKLNSLPISD